MTELRDFEKDLRATLAHAANSADEPFGLADRLVNGATRRQAPHRVRIWLGRRWVPPLLAAAVVAVVAVVTVTTVSSLDAHRPIRPAHSTPVPTPSPSTPSPSTSAAPTPIAPAPPTSAQPMPLPHVVAAKDWDLDGDGRVDDARLNFLGGTGPDNWQLVVDTTSLGRQTVPFTGEPALPGAHDVKIAGSVDADRDGNAEIFVIDQAGASTSSLSIFRLIDQHLVQVTAGSQPVELTWGGTATHMDGFQCAGGTLITTSETTGSPDYKTVSYQKITYAWEGAKLQQTSQQAGTFTGTPEAGVDCGDLSQQARNQPSASQTSSPTSPTTSAPPAAGPWTDSPVLITPHSLGAVTRGMTLAQAKVATGTSVSSPGDSIFRPTDQTLTGSTTLQFSYGATCFGAFRSGSGPGTTVTTAAGVRLGDPMSKIAATYGSLAKPFTADPTWTGPGNVSAGIVVQQGDGVLLFIGSTPDMRGGTITSIRGAANAFAASSVFC